MNIGVTGLTTIEHWLDDDTVAYIGACVILSNDEIK